MPVDGVLDGMALSGDLDLDLAPVVAEELPVTC